MPKDKHPAETYAHEVASAWLYDARGYCPFARHRLEAMLQRAHEAGAASVKAAKVSFTPNQRGVVVDAIDERISVLKELNSVGTPRRESVATIRTLERVRNKLTSKEDGQENENA
jgi:hypothetical protein